MCAVKHWSHEMRCTRISVVQWKMLYSLPFLDTYEKPLWTKGSATSTGEDNCLTLTQSFPNIFDYNNSPLPSTYTLSFLLHNDHGVQTGMPSTCYHKPPKQPAAMSLLSCSSPVTIAGCTFSFWIWIPFPSAFSVIFYLSLSSLALALLYFQTSNPQNPQTI